MTWFDDGGNTPPHEPPAKSDVIPSRAAIVERLMNLPEGLRKGDVRLVDVLAPFDAWCSCPDETPIEVACVQRRANGFVTCGVCGGVVTAP